MDLLRVRALERCECRYYEKRLVTLSSVTLTYLIACILDTLALLHYADHPTIEMLKIMQ